MDRCRDATDKEIRGGVSGMINNRWCRTTVVKKKICTPDIELLSVSLPCVPPIFPPTYLSREKQSRKETGKKTLLSLTTRKTVLSHQQQTWRKTTLSK
ncbi:hypothetical protein SKAU_G00377660 [Synaphobranchus kaupii]|uniref:Uncharacterized protein n=1 Tax=Synaphobranchus kaupii TaxID=118154 RepID=A0A9Q1ED32_SYNKA|nr:hypothetical protein SKAU_G00377660 [Synaphobranchus kaupii]